MPADDLTLRMRAVGARQAAREVDRAKRSVGGLRQEAEHTGKGFMHARSSVRVFSGGLKPMIRVASGAAGALGVLGVAEAVHTMIDSFREARKVERQTEAVIKSTGDAADVSADHVGKLALHLSNMSGISRVTVQESENMLLTFRNIRNETGKGNKIFDRATTTLQDMSVALGVKSKKAAIQLGKALNDPVKGVTALRRVGVTFNDQQTKRIASFVKEGKTMEAQKLILRELNKEFGGSARAQADPLEKLHAAWENLMEELGSKLFPVFAKVINKFTNFTQQIMDGRGAGLKFRNAVEAIWHELATLAKFVWNNKNTIMALVAGYLAFVGALKAVMIIQRVIGLFKTAMILMKALRAGTLAETAAQLGLNVAMVANPVGIVIAAIVALVAIFVVAWKRSATFRNFVYKLWDAFKKTPIGVVISHLGDLVDFLKRMGGKIAQIAPGIWQGLKSGLVSVINWVIDKVNWIIRAFNNTIGKIPGVPDIGQVQRIAQSNGTVAANTKAYQGYRGIPTPMPRRGRRAAGGVAHRAGLYEVGERGRELVALPAGANVLRPGDLAGAVSGGDTHVTLVLPNGDVLAKTVVRAAKKKKASR